MSSLMPLSLPLTKLENSLIGLRHDPRLLKLPSSLSLLCLVVGIAWLLILPLDEYSRHTYVSENALLPGQVSTYFGGSEHNVFRAYRHEVSLLNQATPEEYAGFPLAEVIQTGLTWHSQESHKSWGISSNRKDLSMPNRSSTTT